MIAPKVSVAFITYNHADFVEQALLSVLAQQTRFPVEVVIGDDCSTDGTSEIIQKVLTKGSRHSVKYLLHPHNLGGAQNSDAVLKHCSGDYIAPLEGDDYWTDRNKLQKQTDLLDSQPDASLCFHSCEVMDQSLGEIVAVTPDHSFRRSDLTADEMLYHHMIQTCTKMWRRDLFPNLGRVEGMTQGDRAIDVLLALRGRIVFIDQAMSVYRQHSGGMWTGTSQLKRDVGLYHCFSYLHSQVPSDFKPKVMQMLVGQQVEVITGLRREGHPQLGLTILSFLKNLTRVKRGNRLRLLRWLIGVLLRKPVVATPAIALETPELVGLNGAGTADPLSTEDERRRVTD